MLSEFIFLQIQGVFILGLFPLTDSVPTLDNRRKKIGTFQSLCQREQDMGFPNPDRTCTLPEHSANVLELAREGNEVRVVVAD